MTKSLLAALVAVLLMLPTAVAHGAPESRAIETRILADDDGWTTFAVPHSGHDLLALDVREGHVGTEPALWLRFTWQADAPADMAGDITDTLHLTVGGVEQAYAMRVTYDEILNHDFDAAAGPYEVGDGHPRAVDLALTYETLGVNLDSQITGIRMESVSGEDPTDVMPGTYHAEGELVPYIGDPTHGEAAPAEWTIRGPATLLMMEIGQEALILGEGESANVTINVTNVLHDTEQFVTMSHVCDPELAFGAHQSLVLAPGETRSVAVTVTANDTFHHALATIYATSDLGGMASQPLFVAPSDTTMDAHTGTEAVAHDDHNHTDIVAPAGDQEAPGAPLVLLLVGIAALAILRRH